MKNALAKNPEIYFTQKKYYVIHYQGIVNNKSIFINFNVGWSGLVSIGMRHVWDIWGIVWDSLGHSVRQSQNAWDIKNYQHWIRVRLGLGLGLVLVLG